MDQTKCLFPPDPEKGDWEELKDQGYSEHTDLSLFLQFPSGFYPTLLLAKHTILRQGGKERAGYLQTAVKLSWSLKHSPYCCRQLSKYSNLMEGCWGKLQRKGFSIIWKQGKRGLETDNSNVCFQVGTQQPCFSERIQHESRGHVQMIHVIFLGKKPSVSARERQYIQPLHFNTCKTWSWKNLTHNNPFFMYWLKHIEFSFISIPQEGSRSYWCELRGYA